MGYELEISSGNSMHIKLSPQNATLLFYGAGLTLSGAFLAFAAYLCTVIHGFIKAKKSKISDKN